MAGPLFLGLEIGGTKLQLGLGRGDGHILLLQRLAVDSQAGAAGILAQIAESIDPLLQQIGATRAQLGAVGIGFGGPVDAARGIVTKSNQIDGWDGFPLADWIRQQLEIRVVTLHNDADTAGLGEARFGAGVGVSPILYITVGSGIGGGLIIDGKIYRGSGAGAAEIGHLWIAQPGEASLELERLEQFASGWSIGRAGQRLLESQLKEGVALGRLAALSGNDPSLVSSSLVAEAAAQGDSAACEIFRRASRAMAQALAHAVTLLAPRRIILGGGVSLTPPELWVTPIKETLAGLVFPAFRGTFDLVTAALGEQVVVQGALALARDAYAAAPPCA